MKKIGIATLLLFCIGCNQNPTSETITPTDPAAVSTPALPFFVQNSFPHDPSLFVEGFFVKDGLFYESTGAPVEFPDTRSQIGLMDIKTGKFSAKAELDRKIYFGEGIAIVKDKLYQLTYKNQQGFIYDAATFKKLGDFKYANSEGWGLTTDGGLLIMSDGTAKLTWLDPAAMKPVKTVQVTENGAPLSQINELEFINGLIYANVWQTNFIVQIDPETGKVIGKMDLSNIVTEQLKDNPDAQELNGIAYNNETKKLYVTGKMWSKIYELDLPALKAKN